MPEGHTLRKLADELTAAFAGRRVRVTSPQGRSGADAEQVDGARQGRGDDHGGEVYVYRRTSLPCLVCGATVRTAELVGRNISWCSRCQPKFRSRAVPSPSRKPGASGGARA